MKLHSPAANDLDLDQSHLPRGMSMLVDKASQASVRAAGRVERLKTMSDRLMSEMVRNQRPLNLREDATIAEACRQMHERRAGAVMVTNADGHLLGIFTGRDAVRILAQDCAADGPLEAAMTRSPATMPPGQPAIDALRLMQDGGFRHLPVVDGVVSWGDFRTSEHDRLDTKINLWERIYP